MEKKAKKTGIRQVVRRFGGGREAFYYITLAASALSGVLIVLPYYFIWKLAGEIILRYESLTPEAIRKYALLIFVTQIIVILSGVLANICSHLLAFRVEKNIRRQAIAHFLELPIGFFENEDSGRLRRLIDDNASNTHSFLAHVFPDIMAATVAPLALLALIIMIDWRFGLLCILGIGAAMFFMQTLMGEEAKNYMADYMASSEALSVNGVEFIRGIPVVKVFNQTVESFQRFYQTIMNYDQKAKFFVNYCKKPMLRYTLSLFAPTLLTVLLAIGLIGGAENPRQLFVNALFYVMTSLLLHNLLMKFAMVSEAQGMYQVTFQKLDELFAQAKMPVLPGEHRAEEGIVLEGVTFTYPGKPQPAVKDFSFHFAPNKSYALVGASGSGKSTLLRLMARFYDTDSGSIRLNGTPVTALPEEELLSRFAIVFQESHLLKTSLRENITMGGSFSDEEIHQALRLSAAEDILARMPEGLDTKIGSEGTYVSGGEAQRLALARAFLRQAPILLLDEATAFADPENEHKIQAALQKLKTGKTTIMVAHRLNTVQEADQILVMQAGSLIACGSHDELMKNCSYYQNLYQEYQRSIEWRVSND